MEQVDVILIGSGQGGVPFAVSMAQAGRRVVVFERAAWGGSCPNVACTPSKAFLAAAHYAGSARFAAELGVHLQVEVDFSTVMERVQRVAADSSQSVVRRLQEAGVRMVHAGARFTGVRTVSGGDVTASAPLVVINTGKSPRPPGISGLQGLPYRTYLDFWDLRQKPRNAVVLGGGYTGVELGQGLARLGVATHIVEHGERLVSHEEEEVSQALRDALAADGASFSFGAQIEQVEHRENEFRLRLAGGQALAAELLLVATGRSANTRSLNAEASRIELDERGHVKVDDRFQTSCDGVYAIGDVTGQPAFTHVSWEDGLRLEAILRGEDRRQGDRPLAYAFFTEPEVGRVGLTLAAAREKGLRARQADYPLVNVARALEAGRTHGFFRVVVDEDTDKILGATLVGPAAGELVHIVMALMQAGAEWQTLGRMVAIHPTFAEGLASLGQAM